VEVWQTSNLGPLRLGEEKKKKKNKRKNENIYGLPYYTGRTQMKSNNILISMALMLVLRQPMTVEQQKYVRNQTI